jgi:hypothetical protein
MQVTITLKVEYDDKTTGLSPEQHKRELDTSLRRAVGAGLLTAHEPEVEVECYSIE